jgi:rubrerythrin
VKRFSDLSEQEVLALAITNEEEDSRIYRGFAEGLREQFPTSAKVFDEMAEEEVHHRTMLFDLYRKKFGDYLPLIRRQDVKGFLHPKQPLWLTRPLGLEEVRKFAENMEFEAERYYRKAAENARDASVRQLLVELAEAEAGHESLAHKLSQKILTTGARAKEDETARRMFVLQYVQPASPVSWTARYRRLRRCLRRPSRHTAPGKPFWLAWRPLSARASQWVLPKRSLTTVR